MIHIKLYVRRTFVITSLLVFECGSVPMPLFVIFPQKSSNNKRAELKWDLSFPGKIHQVRSKITSELRCLCADRPLNDRNVKIWKLFPSTPCSVWKRGLCCGLACKCSLCRPRFPLWTRRSGCSGCSWSGGVRSFSWARTRLHNFSPRDSGDDVYGSEPRHSGLKTNLQRKQTSSNKIFSGDWMVCLLIHRDTMLIWNHHSRLLTSRPKV